MIILDTNVLSELMRLRPDPSVLRWLDRQPASSIWTTSINMMELRFGLQAMPPGKRSASMMQELEAVLKQEIEGRSASFDMAAADQAAKLMAAGKLHGRPADFRDTHDRGHCAFQARTSGHQKYC
jgi:toxin FitB